jgi:hypothetical protein
VIFSVRTLCVVLLWVCLSSLSMLLTPALIEFNRLSTYQMLSVMHLQGVHIWKTSIIQEHI